MNKAFLFIWAVLLVLASIDLASRGFNRVIQWLLKDIETRGIDPRI